ncbi:unnamed protein product [Mytilus edulis]|uniref:Uncharacterized protein n=1 Tax=Mytilus edulis TaxID=6550 RepID=A0A8S3RVF2_MYTED|nr:unnamed protein product [Mytilus edulis]
MQSSCYLRSVEVIMENWNKKLHTAAGTGNVNDVKKCLENKADIDYQDRTSLNVKHSCNQRTTLNVKHSCNQRTTLNVKHSCNQRTTLNVTHSCSKNNTECETFLTTLNEISPEIKEQHLSCNQRTTLNVKHSCYQRTTLKVKHSCNQRMNNTECKHSQNQRTTLNVKHSCNQRTTLNVKCSCNQRTLNETSPVIRRTNVKFQSSTTLKSKNNTVSCETFL